ncbi:MAG: hypothetical protein GXP06_14240 [Alphaproteobacteria bacterium]|nr:hypothetical protein [Alphaproteobacteria bacterium]
MMSDDIQPLGPFYVELVYEKIGKTATDAIDTAFVDGFSSEAEAWRACRRLRREPFDAVSTGGENIFLKPAQLLQMFIAKAAPTNAFIFAGE